MAKKKTSRLVRQGGLARGKKAWKNFEVIKVKLNPEQAVLSCCNAGIRPGMFGIRDTQCWAVCDGGTSESAASS